MFYTEEEKRQIVAEYNRKYFRARLISLGILLIFAAGLFFVPKRMLYTAAGKRTLYGAAVVFGLLSWAQERPVMRCPLCGRNYGFFYKNKPNICPHCGEFLGQDSYTGQ